MLRKRPTQRSTTKQKNRRRANAQRTAISGTANTLPIAREQAASARTAEARLKSVAKETFQNMGED